jgi:molybdate transport system ATP-binding protein
MPIRISVEHRHGFLQLNVGFEAPSTGFTVLSGPSAAGTSFMLSAIAGLQRAHHVRVELDGEPLHQLPAHRRRIGMVFPEGRLFRHLSVEDNLLFGLKRLPKTVADMPGRCRGPLLPGEIVDLLGLQNLRSRRPADLSSSERQRVAIGRAVLAQPRLLLMDEPLSTLDASQRMETLHYLQRLRAVLPIPVLYAAHSMEEACRLAHFMVLLEGGQVLGAGPLPELASRVDLPLAARNDSAAVLAGYLHSHAPARGLSAVACGSIIIDATLCDIPEEAPVRVRVPAREVLLALDKPEDTGANNIISGMVCAIRHDATSHAALVEIEFSGGQLLARMATDGAQRLRLEPGKRVFALVKSVSAEVMSV